VGKKGWGGGRGLGKKITFETWEEEEKKGKKRRAL